MAGAVLHPRRRGGRRPPRFPWWPPSRESIALKAAITGNGPRG